MSRLLSSRVLLIILLILAIIVIIYCYRQVLAERRLKIEYEALVKKIEDLKTQNASLEDEMEKLKNAEELERLARELYVLKKPDEKTMVVPQEIMEQLKEQPEIEVEKEPFFQRILNNIKEFFKDLF